MSRSLVIVVYANKMFTITFRHHLNIDFLDMTDKLAVKCPEVLLKQCHFTDYKHP